MKALKKISITIVVIAIILGVLYAIWTFVVPEKWINQVKEAFGIMEDSGITGEEYTEFDTDYYPYYGFLSDEGKKLYAQVYANALNEHTTFVPVVDVTFSEADNVVKAVFYDHPELFWMDSGFSYKFVENDICVQITLQFNETFENIDKARKEFDSKANEIIEEASKLNDDYEKEKYVYEIILATTEYDEKASVNQSAYSTLVNGKSVCAGYARAFQYVMTKLKIPTYYCAGKAEGHAWNIVKLENGYYNVDLTWDDEKGTTYKYFNRTDDSLGRSHNRSGYSVLLPKCKAKKYCIE